MRWLSPDLYLHPREAALCGVSLLFSIAVLLFAFLSISEADDDDDLEGWSQRRWERVPCRFMETGVMYTGDCERMDVSLIRSFSLRPNYSYAECPYDMEPSCESFVKTSFETSERLVAMAEDAKASGQGGAPGGIGPGGGDDAGGETPSKASASAAPGRRLKGRKSPIGMMCENAFVPWAAAAVGTGADGEGGATGNIRACAYRSGLLHRSSVMHLRDAKRIAASYRRESRDGTCWRLTLRRFDLADVHRCVVVALEDPSLWMLPAQKLAREHRRTQDTLLWASLATACTAAIAAAMHHCWICGSPWMRGAKGMLNASAACESAERAQGVKDRWRLFRAHVLAEYRPIDSARECVQSAADDDCGGGSGGQW